MMSVLLITIFCMSGLSLLSYVYCWQDIRRGHPHILSLRQITNIMDRNRLNLLFGNPEPGYYYDLSPVMLAFITRFCGLYYYCEIAADIVCIFGVYHFMTYGAHSPLAGWFVLLAATCQGINFLYSVWLIRRWGHQIREEMEDIR